MPDYLKELRGVLVDGMGHIISKDARQRGIEPALAGRLFGSGVGYDGGNGSALQNFFTTGYDSGSGETTVPFIVGFSDVDGEDIVTA